MCLYGMELLLRSLLFGHRLTRIMTVVELAALPHAFCSAVVC